MIHSYWKWPEDELQEVRLVGVSLMLTQLGVSSELRKASPWRADVSTSSVAGPGDNLESPPCSPARLSLRQTGNMTSPCRSALGFAGCLWTKTGTVWKQTFPRTTCPSVLGNSQRNQRWLRTKSCKRLHLHCAGIAEKAGNVAFPFTRRPRHLWTGRHSSVAAEERLHPGLLHWSSGPAGFLSQ